MLKRVILITGTPCVGKTTVAQALAAKLDALNLNLTELAIRENLILGKDKKRNSIIVNEKKMKQRIRNLIETCEEDNIIVDGHYAVNVVASKLASHVFVLRRNPLELRKLMEQSGFSGAKLWENLESEILDVCLIDALNVQDKEKVCELDASGKTVKEVVTEILNVLEGHNRCYVGIVDWIGKLESEGLLDEYLRI